MKKLFITLLILGFLTPTTFEASTNNTFTKAEVFAKKQKKKSSKKTKSTKKSDTKRNCTYNGNQLYVGPRGGCYYYSGNSKQYVDRGYCSGCN